MKIFAVIVTYNAMRRNWIDRCLESLQKSTVPVTAIVVDNLSSDGTREHIPTHWPDAVWLPQDNNWGFGQANNIGIRYALKHEADYVLLLNQDAALHPKALQLLLQETDGQSLMTPAHYNGDGTKLDFMFSRAILKASTELTEENIMGDKLPDCCPAKEICAACWLMPVKLIEKVGGFNPLFFQYSEDNNYYQRMVYHGLGTTRFVPKAKMYHDRQIYGNAKVYHRNMLRRNMLLLASNINLSFPRFVAKWLRLFLRCYVYDLWRCLYIPGTYTIDSFWLLGKACSIKESRKKEKKQGKTWL